MITKKREIGNFGETAAVKYLKRKHYKILERNYTAGKLELDIIAKKRREIVFIEVKTRSVLSLDSAMPYGRAADAVDLDRIAAIRDRIDFGCTSFVEILDRVIGADR